MTIYYYLALFLFPQQSSSKFLYEQAAYSNNFQFEMPTQRDWPFVNIEHYEAQKVWWSMCYQLCNPLLCYLSLNYNDNNIKIYTIVHFQTGKTP